MMTSNLCKSTYALMRANRSLMHNIHRRAFPLTKVNRSYSSALYISGKTANKVFAYVTPYLDVDKRFTDMNKLQNELTLRGMDVDVVELKKMWEFYKQLDADKCTLEEHHEDIINRKKDLQSSENTSEKEQEIFKLRMQLQVIREDIKTTKNAIWELDSDIIEKILKLPNELDPRTPIGEPVVLKNVGNLPDSNENSKSHIEIGTNLGLLDYRNPIYYYLCNDAAFFELAVLAYANRVLGDNNNMLRVIGTDFSRSLVVEGSGLNHEDPMTAFLIENREEVERGSSNRMHLIGGASLISFLTLHTKQLINPKDFPLKYIATGRQYTPPARDSQLHGLFTVCQASAAHAFLIIKDGKSEECKVLFDELVESVCQLYDDLCDHYRVVMRPVSQLQPWEGLRVSFELWSPFLKQYVEVGHVSACGDYFSKRLLITYQTNYGRDFPAIITGTVLSVPRLLACLLERDPQKFTIPPKVADLMFSDDATNINNEKIVP